MVELTEEYMDNLCVTLENELRDTVPGFLSLPPPVQAAHMATRLSDEALAYELDYRHTERGLSDTYLKACSNEQERRRSLWWS